MVARLDYLSVAFFQLGDALALSGNFIEKSAGDISLLSGQLLRLLQRLYQRVEVFKFYKQNIVAKLFCVG
ncbi:hypothetical protein A3N60_09685 [Klebsiella aerogenes]|nr:hypothetical protein SS11_01120 [Klebsiella aerogenes]KUQ34179.1 hypothetical protein AWI14_18080 [Klebsiella aerogenes]KZR35018.1 hypothetical protein A3N60_09685 [Klebsiella aerogenes]